jgi:hypothetical protein
MIIVSFKGQHIQISFSGKSNDLRRRILEKKAFESQLKSHFDLFLDREAKELIGADVPKTTQKVYLKELESADKSEKYHVHFLEKNGLSQVTKTRCRVLESLGKKQFQREFKELSPERDAPEKMILNGTIFEKDSQLGEVLDTGFPYLVEIFEAKLDESIDLNQMPEEKEAEEQEEKGMEALERLNNLLDELDF